MANRRVPQVGSSKSAIEPDVKKQKEFFCCRCGKYFGRQNTNFPTSKSGLYAGNNGFLPICKNCVGELYQYYCETLSSPVAAAERVCSKFDIYFNQAVFDDVISASSPNVVMTSYIGRIGATLDGKTKSYDDNISEKEAEIRDLAESGDLDRDNEIIKAGRKVWGLDLEAKDYEYLDNEFSDWNDRCAIDGKTRESLVREICVIKLQQNKALLSGDIETYNKLSSTFQKTLTTAELTPKQETDAKRASEKPMGVMIQMFENNRPIPKPNPEWEDVDGIQKLIRVFFMGHLCKMLGIKNKYAEEYEEYLLEYSAILPEDTNSDDDDDVYDYLIEHGFSEEESEEDESDDTD